LCKHTLFTRKTKSFSIHKYYCRLQYEIDKISKNLKQSTPLYTKDTEDETYLGSDKSHLLERIQFRDDNIYISNVYVNSRSGTPYITVVVNFKEEYYVFDFIKFWIDNRVMIELLTPDMAADYLAAFSVSP